MALFYQRAFQRRPAVTLAVTGGILNVLGDFLAQKVEDRSSSFDSPRTMRFFTFGACLAPVLGRWNSFLEYRFPLSAGGGRNLIGRVLLDQFFMAPIGLALFFGSMSAMEGMTLTQTKDKFLHIYWATLQTNWKVWPAIQAVNFRFLPLAYRVPFNMSCGVAWTVYLSLINSREAISERMTEH